MTAKHVNSIDGKCGDCRGHRCLDSEVELTTDGGGELVCANCGHEADEYAMMGDES